MCLCWALVFPSVSGSGKWCSPGERALPLPIAHHPLTLETAPDSDQAGAGGLKITLVLPKDAALTVPNQALLAVKTLQRNRLPFAVRSTFPSKPRKRHCHPLSPRCDRAPRDPPPLGNNCSKGRHRASLRCYGLQGLQASTQTHFWSGVRPPRKVLILEGFHLVTPGSQFP